MSKRGKQLRSRAGNLEVKFEMERNELLVLCHGLRRAFESKSVDAVMESARDVCDLLRAKPGYWPVNNKGILEG